MRRFKLTIAYDGRPFSGWQSQPDGNTVQDILLGALQSFCKEIGTVQGSGRTDSGVSADGQVAHFDAPGDWSMDAEAWLKALNTQLPREIRVMKSAEVDSEFHARFSALEKTYRYRLFTGPVLPPLLAGLAWHQRRVSDGTAVGEIIRVFEGEHDFRALSAKRHDGKDEERDTVRKISSARATEAAENLWELEFVGNGFLYKMVRFLVGASVQVATKALEPEALLKMLKSGEGVSQSMLCAPADGLRLVNVRYPQES